MTLSVVTLINCPHKTESLLQTFLIIPSLGLNVNVCVVAGGIGSTLNFTLPVPTSSRRQIYDYGTCCVVV